MLIRRFLAMTAALAAAIGGVTAPAHAEQGVRVGKTTVEYAGHPLGIDTEKPG
jgi:ABC-type glycerol-3-phosphate transport system substrate-binding protein